MKYLCAVGLQIEALEVLTSKSCGKQTLILWIEIGACFLQLFYPSTPKASNCDANFRDFVTRNIFIIFAP